MTAATVWDAFHDQLLTGLAGRAQLWDSRRPDGAVLPGVVLRSDPGTREVVKLSGESTARTTRFWTVSVGAGPDQARALRGIVEASVLDARLAVTGLQCWPVRHDDSDLVRPDEGEHPRPTVYVGVDVWAIRNQPV